MNLSRKQINELITGVLLSAELPSSAPELRRFVSVRGYTKSERGIRQLDRVISEDKIQTTAFWIRDYEVPSFYIEHDLEIPDCEIVNVFFTEGIIGIENAERELKMHLADLTRLVPHWACDAPLG